MSKSNRKSGKGAKITVSWGYEEKTLTLTPRNWNRVRKGRSLSIRGQGYGYEGEFFWDYWYFEGGSTAN